MLRTDDSVIRDAGLVSGIVTHKFITDIWPGVESRPVPGIVLFNRSGDAYAVESLLSGPYISVFSWGV